MPDYQAVPVLLKGQHTVMDVLTMVCKVRDLDPAQHCLRLQRHTDEGMEVCTPAGHEPLQDLSYTQLEVSPLDVCTLYMTRPSLTGDFGFAVTGHVDSLHSSRIVVSEVLPDGVAFREGLRPGDEILVLNGCEVSSLDLAHIQTRFSEQTLHLTVRRNPPSYGLPDPAPTQAHNRQQRPQQLLKDHLYGRHRAKSATGAGASIPVHAQKHVRPQFSLTPQPPSRLVTANNAHLEHFETPKVLLVAQTQDDVSCVVQASAPAVENGLQQPRRHQQAAQHSKGSKRAVVSAGPKGPEDGAQRWAPLRPHRGLPALAHLLEDMVACVACWKMAEGLDTSTEGSGRRPVRMTAIGRVAERPLAGCPISSLRALEAALGLRSAHGHLVGSVSCGSQSVEAVCTLYRSFQEDSEGLMEDRKGSAVPEAALLRPCPRHMSVTERLRKVIQELVDTEKSYVKDLASLFEIYLKPLQKETFLTQDEMESLFGSLPEMLDFQKVFLQTLEERIASSPDFSTLETPVQFKARGTANAKLLFSLGGSFLYYADHFKLYSGFCANHIKVQKVLERAKTDRAFKEFLDARNPTKQHSSTLESYLIKPVQRVLKYPLLLRELVSLTDTDSEEHYHLTEALKAMEKVASHINEMQKIYDDYGAVFDQVVAEHSGPEKEVTEISMGEFLMHSSVIWLNPFQSLGRMKKEPELTVFVFKKAVILVYRENKLKKKMNVPRAAHSQGDQDPFKFRWLIPLSALQVRLGNTAETNCIWELIHTKSEAEGRPEMVFHLCSSMPECKINIVKVIRSLLRETARRGMRSAEKTCKGRFTPVRSAVPSSARLGSSRASWLCSKTIDVHSLAQSNRLKPPLLDSDSASESSGAPSGGAPPPDPPAPLTQPALGHDNTKESHVLSDDDDGGFSECLGRHETAPDPMEAQFRELRLAEETSRAPAPRAQPEGAGETDPDPETDPPDKRRAHPPLQRAHFCPVRRKVGGGDSSLRRRQGTLVNMRQHSRSLDSQSESALAGMDLTAVLEREFSVQSLTSVVNEDCFFDAATKGPESGAT
ncbi:hypothetical protein P4O66_011583 [Electrophorus voltai]|uniref:TIAM Rac1 associated GEF 2a n=1 Tax=Electrophorus voltai TaxID=2609070 RepID=A0AAD8Z863_9TELE|nr:hypothetical protein P4O66_011583 [Electrophorus voltai]